MSQPLSFLHQRGTAIIAALLVVSLVAAVSVAMLIRLQSDIQRTEILLNADQAYLYAQGSVAWAIDVLNNNWLKRKPQQVIDATPITSTKNQIQGFTIQSIIIDAQGLFNLNNASDERYEKDFTQLVKSIAPQLSNEKLNELQTALMDWISSSNPQPELNNYYMSQTPAYRAPHHFMASPSELRLIKGMTPELYNALLPYVIALPITTQINVNNAAGMVLSSLSPNLNVAQTNGVAKQSQADPFADTTRFLSTPAIKTARVDGSKVTVMSNYFLLKTYVSIGQQQTIIYTLLARTTENNKAETTIVWQTKGTL